MAKTTFVICPTYRNPMRPANMGLFGSVSLIEQIKNQDYQGNIKLAVIDSSAEPHPFFKSNVLEESGMGLYLHVPSRNQFSEEYKKDYSFASRFIPNDKMLQTPEWQNIISKVSDWDYFIPWDDDYPVKQKLIEQLLQDRPAIGMKRNFGIAALAEKYGAAEYIVYADDDDYRSSTYVREITETLNTNDFTRVFQYLTYVINPSQDGAWGVNDIDFQKDANGNWLPPKDMLDMPMLNMLSTDDFKTTVGKAFSKLKCVAFPPIGYDGAMQAYRYDLWQKSVDAFGGVPPISMCEDVFYYKGCQSHFGAAFQANKTPPTELNFLRLSDSANASVIQWTKNLSEKEVPKWAKDSIQNLLSSYNMPASELSPYFESLALEYKKKSALNWNDNKTFLLNRNEADNTPQKPKDGYSPS